MAKILLVTHGQAASGMMDSLSMFVGEIQGVSSFTLTGNEQESLNKQLKEFIQKNIEEEILVLTDIFGGSPFQECLKLKYELNAKIEIVSGLNFPMLLEVYISKTKNLEELLTLGLNSGKNGISSPHNIELDEDDE